MRTTTMIRLSHLILLTAQLTGLLTDASHNAFVQVFVIIFVGRGWLWPAILSSS